MRKFYLFLIAIFFLPISPSLLALDYEEARHLLSRCGFGGTPSEIDRLLPLSQEKAVQAILNTMQVEPTLAPPEWLKEPMEDIVKKKTLVQVMSEEQRQQYQKIVGQQMRQRAIDLKAWWYSEMIATKSPFTERMVLFWHNHFTSSLEKVRFPRLMYNQNALFSL